MPATPSMAPATAPADYPRPTPARPRASWPRPLSAPRRRISPPRDGYAAWLDAQLAMPPSQTHFGWLLQQGRNTEEYKGNGINAPLDATLWRKFISAPDQVRTRVAFALSEIFVVNVASITASWPLFGAAGFMDLLAEHALGNYRSLLAAVSRNLSMAAC